MIFGRFPNSAIALSLSTASSFPTTSVNVCGRYFSIHGCSNSAGAVALTLFGAKGKKRGKEMSAGIASMPSTKDQGRHREVAACAALGPSPLWTAIVDTYIDWRFAGGSPPSTT